MLCYVVMPLTCRINTRLGKLNMKSAACGGRRGRKEGTRDKGQARELHFIRHSGRGRSVGHWREGGGGGGGGPKKELRCLRFWGIVAIAYCPVFRLARHAPFSSI